MDQELNLLKDGKTNKTIEVCVWAYVKARQATVVTTVNGTKTLVFISNRLSVKGKVGITLNVSCK